MTGLVHFSVDAASNDVAVPPINFQEGQSANSVNNSMREVMAALARWHADLAGGLVATGTAGNALFVNTNQSSTQTLSHAPSSSPHGDQHNTEPATLSIDGLPARSMRRRDQSVLGPGDLHPGLIYRLCRDVENNRLVVVGPTIKRAGKSGHFASEEAVPPGWVICDGRAVPHCLRCPVRSDRDEVGRWQRH